MLNLTEMLELRLLYLILIFVQTGLSAIFYIYRRKARELSKLKVLITILIVFSFSIQIIDSIPYLFIDIFQFPEINIIFSNIFLFAISISTILFLIAVIEKEQNVLKK